MNTPTEEFAALVDAMLARSEATYGAHESRGARRSFGSTSLKANGKIFAMLVKDRLVVKLAGQRVDELVEQGVGDRFDPGTSSHTFQMAVYKLNRRAVAHAKRLIEAGRYVLESDWGEAQPRADDENQFLESHSWADYAPWHLGLTDGANDETKARYAFVFGDFKRLHRSGLIASHYRAAEFHHKEIELAAHRLLQILDKKAYPKG